MALNACLKPHTDIRTLPIDAKTLTKDLYQCHRICGPLSVVVIVSSRQSRKVIDAGKTVVSTQRTIIAQACLETTLHLSRILGLPSWVPKLGCQCMIILVGDPNLRISYMFPVWLSPTQLGQLLRCREWMKGHTDAAKHQW